MRTRTFALLLLPLSAFAAGDGTTGAEFLKVAPGARGAAMGEAQTAAAEDVFAAHWNPAALGGLKAAEISLMHNTWLEDVHQQYAAAALPAKSAGTFALSYNRLSVDDLEGYDAMGTPRGTLTGGASAASLGWGRNFSSRFEGGGGLMGGAALKTVSEEHAGVGASSLAADLGLLWRPAVSAGWLRRSSLGLAFRNMGQGLTFDRETLSLPAEISLGLGYSHFLAGDAIALTADLRRTAGEDDSFGAGAEYRLKDLFALRAGYRAADAEDAGLRAGAGIRLRGLQIDYAWAGMGEDLGAAHRVSLTYRFGDAPAALHPGLAGETHRYHKDQGRRAMDLGLYDRAVLHFHDALRVKPGDDETLKLLLECGEKMKGTP